MSRKRGRPESFPESPKKRLRSSPTEQITPEPPDPGLIEARRSLHEIERDNLHRRVQKMQKTIKKAMQSFARDMKRCNQTQLALRVQKIADNFRLPINYDAAMAFIDSYTGVKKRHEPSVCWDITISRNWLNRQRANVYGPTLFTNILECIDRLGKEIGSADPGNVKWLHVAVARKLLPEVFRGTYKPKSKQAAEKKLICSNTMKQKNFRERVGDLTGWGDEVQQPNLSSLESVAHRAEREYEEMLKRGYGILDDTANCHNTPPRRPIDSDIEIDNENVDTEGWCLGTKKSVISTSQSGSPQSPVIDMDISNFVPFQSLPAGLAGSSSSASTTTSVRDSPPRETPAATTAHPPVPIAVPTTTRITGFMSMEQLQGCNKQELIQQCYNLKAQADYYSDRVKQQQRQIDQLRSQVRHINVNPHGVSSHHHHHHHVSGVRNSAATIMHRRDGGSAVPPPFETVPLNIPLPMPPAFGQFRVPPSGVLLPSLVAPSFPTTPGFPPSDVSSHYAESITDHSVMDGGHSEY